MKHKFPTWTAGRNSLFLSALALSSVTVVAAEGANPRTTLDNPAIKFTVPDKPFVVLRGGALEAVIADNRAVDDAVLPGHRAGYHGVASLKHDRQQRNLFVPAYSGLNFEHIHDGTVQQREILFEPRNAPMQLRVIDPCTAELYQAPTPHWGLESCMRYHLRDEEVIELTFECIPRRDPYKNGYIGLLWANYIDQPESRDTHFLAPGKDTDDPPRWRPNGQWVHAASSAHGVLATHLAQDDHRQFAHDPDFPLTLVFNLSQHRYLEPWYFGVCRGMAYVQIFRPQDRVRLSQSPSGGGQGNPAWDFQWFISDHKLGQRYQLVMRVLYTVHETNPKNPFESEERLLTAIKHAQKLSLAQRQKSSAILLVCLVTLKRPNRVKLGLSALAGRASDETHASHMAERRTA